MGGHSTHVARCRGASCRRQRAARVPGTTRTWFRRHRAGSARVPGPSTVVRLLWSDFSEITRLRWTGISSDPLCRAPCWTAVSQTQVRHPTEQVRQEDENVDSPDNMRFLRYASGQTDSQTNKQTNRHTDIETTTLCTSATSKVTRFQASSKENS